MQEIEIDTLPKCVLEFFDAINARDSGRFMATFSPDALINDVERDFLGTDAIKAWADKEVLIGVVILTIVQAFEHYGDYVLKVDADGDFDKTHLPDPLIMTQHFSVHDDQIVKMISLLVKPSEMSLEDALAPNAS